MSLQILIILSMPEEGADYCRRLREKFPDVTVNWVHHHSEAGPYLKDADVIMSYGRRVSADTIRQADRLKWFQVLGTGVDGAIDHLAQRPDVILASTRGIQGAPVSEAVIGGMLALARDVPRIVRDQATHRQDRWGARLLQGSTAGILGVGMIAEALAPRLKGLGVTVVGITGTPRELDGFERMVPRAEFRRIVGGLDWLVVLVPYTRENHHVVSADIIAAMKPQSFLVNVARGGLVDDTALATALREGRLAGAALDVFEVEPLPEDHPLWTLPNVILTHHTAGHHQGTRNDTFAVIEENLRCFLAGDTDNMIKRVAR